MEIFRKIKDFEEEYEVSNYGNVKSLKNGKEIIMKPSIDTSGYFFVGLYKNKKTYKKKIHRLVAEAFIPNPDNLPCVNHKDENKLNNFVWVNDDGSVDIEKSNLEWCTHEYNINYGTAIERRVAKQRGQKRTEETRRKMSESQKGLKKPKISEVLKGRKISKESIEKRVAKLSKSVVAVKDGIVVMEFASSAEARRNGFNQGNISECCNGKRRTCSGYQWFLKTEWLKMQQATHDRVACGKLDIE